MAIFIPVTMIAARTIYPGGALFHHDQNIRRRFILSPPLPLDEGRFFNPYNPLFSL